jgi:hypothetical protein
MNLSEFGTEQYRTYYESRIDRLPRNDHKGEISTHCPFHNDRMPSFSVNIENGRWKCHAGCGGGHLMEFEKKHSGCDDVQALKNIAEAVGQPMLAFRDGTNTVEARYEYADESGHPLFIVTKYRFPDGRKTFRQGHVDANGKYVPNMDGVRRVLYNVRDVVAANTVYISEGEKDCHNLQAVFGGGDSKVFKQRIAFTTNPGGATKWLAEYSPYLTGKEVVIFADNDDIGRTHAEHVADAISTFAHRIKIVHLTDVPEKGDVSDYLATHTREDLVGLMRAAPLWEALTNQIEPERFVSAVDFMASTAPEIDWMIEHVIQRGANGFICASPKIGKSWTALDMALSLALGFSWMGFRVPHRVKVALVSREDNPALTSWRMSNLLNGKAAHPQELAEHLYVNSRASQKTMMLDNELELSDLVSDLKRNGTEFLILDVFNVLHGADENDNTAMRQVLNQVTRIQNEVGCSICIVHHWNKSREGSITEKLRGASAIAGWAEWVIGLSMDNQDQRVRKVEFDLKVASAPEPVHFQISQDDDAGVALRRVDSPLRKKTPSPTEILRGPASASYN